jgi:hypothetical protein
VTGEGISTYNVSTTSHICAYTCKKVMIWRWGIARIFHALYMVMLKLISIFALVRSAVNINVSNNRAECSIKVFNLDNFKKYVIMHNVVPGLQIFRQFVSTFGAVSIVLLRQCGLLIF